jgi:hypothetical protein
MKSPPKRGASHGTNSLESGSVRPSRTGWPRFGPTLAVAAGLSSKKSGVTVATRVVGSRVTE